MGLAANEQLGTTRRVGTADLDLLLDGQRFLGIGRVRVDGIVLRSSRLPWMWEIRTPDGWELTDWELVAERAVDGGFDLELQAVKRSTGTMAWMLHAMRPRYRVADWSRASEPAAGTRLVFSVRPTERQLGDDRATGFSYAWRFTSPDLRIIQVHDRGSWEIGGTATGNAVWMRGSFAPPIARFTTPEDSYSTEWYLPSIANPNIFQYVPLQTHMQGFTCTQGATGVLFTWANRVSHIRTLLEKPTGREEICHLHEHCGDLSGDFRTATMEVLFVAGARDTIGCANLHERMRELVVDTLHAELGMRTERILPYAVVEEWGEANLERYAEEALPLLAGAGIRRVGLANHFAHNMNVYGISNMCCTLDYRWPDERVRRGMVRLGEQAKRLGIALEMWGNTAVSSLTPMFAQRNGTATRIDFWQAPDEGVMAAVGAAADPWVRNQTGFVETDHYSPVFQLLNLRDPVIRAYWHARWKAARDESGLSGMFLDSSFNLSSDKLHWTYLQSRTQGATIDQIGLLGQQRPPREPEQTISSLYRAHLDTIVEMQRYGYVYNGEDLGVFGLHRTGPSALAKRDNLFLWCDVHAVFDGRAIRESGGDPDDIFFRGLAYRQIWIMYWLPKLGRLSWNAGAVNDVDDVPTTQQCEWLRTFARVVPAMTGREILPGETGVVYRSDGDRWVLWSFIDQVVRMPDGLRIVGAEASDSGGLLHARRHGIYEATRDAQATRAVATGTGR